MPYQSITVQFLGGPRCGDEIELPSDTKEVAIKHEGQIYTYKWANRTAKNGVWIIEFKHTSLHK